MHTVVLVDYNNFIEEVSDNDINVDQFDISLGDVKGVAGSNRARSDCLLLEFS